ncbi:MAG TPA: ATP-binding protein, partial [Polyangia bacterium]|nr:ATP-binding protein [Polyangia bacterium]
HAEGRTIDVEIADEPALVDVDVSSIERVISNLIDNALKYTEGAIEVRVDVEPERARFIVTDHGPGIPVEHRANLFSRFYRVASQSTLQQRGLGLGLFISRQIVLRHGGDIGFQSEVGRGSTFYFTLPRRR